MRWEDGRRSDNVEDRRGSKVTRGVVGGGVGTVILVLVAMYFGVDPSFLLNMASTESSRPGVTGSAARPADENRMAEFVSVVLADTEDTWRELFRQGGNTYREPKLVLFTGVVQSACGTADAAVGPFYCPGDQKVYIDLAFYQELKNRFAAPGDFAQAYVIAHEVGHHVQNLLGVSDKVHAAQSRASRKDANRLSVLQELQADCLAGVWANHADKARHILESGDVEEALNAASAIGDDRLQRQSQGTVVPDAFTHGTSEQRVRWFNNGLKTGDINQCNTFKAAQL
ncbi:KPN_02809 family neutral zinc metallopeptidase [Geomobilimonas luticola]|uniref:Zinc metallopeptidase n=1 Tax=Geomobilimonas luticola TaxID=1114878 RepID=A0ABS5SCP0_9BACT|nr:neutral zinc metallopeptidase [Geomobilimonas luticola]MBT0653140.1 zinc metallopeptidase [Geomobilimonas luticola]